jgi:serine/threonine protein kinase
MLTVKWLRVGLVKHKKEFAKEVKKIGSIRHPNIVPLRAYYWGPREQERLLLADYIQGDSLALHLYGKHFIMSNFVYFSSCFYFAVYRPTLIGF